MKSNFAISSGSAQSVTINNGKAKTNGLKWDANYNGEVANVDLNLNENGREQHYKVEMTNEELEKIANMFATRSNDEIIDKRRTQSTVLLSSPVFREKAPYFWMLVLKRPQSEYI